MEFDKVIRERRSIRAFKQEDVSDAQVREIIEAGILAPSAKNAQPWRFVVIRDKQIDELCRAMEEFHTQNPEIPCSITKTVQVMREAPVCILVFLPERIEKMAENAPWQFLIPDLTSIGACFENMTLKAHDMGLGSLWICDVLYARDFAESFGQGCQIAGALSVGVPDEQPPARPRKPLEEVTRFGAEEA